MIETHSLPIAPAIKQSIISVLKRKDTKIKNTTSSSGSILTALCANGAKIEFINSDMTNSYVISVNGICIGWSLRSSENNLSAQQKQDIIDILSLMRKKYLATLPKTTNKTEKPLTAEENFIINILEQNKSKQR